MKNNKNSKNKNRKRTGNNKNATALGNLTHTNALALNKEEKHT